jgi:hypothetical protein
MIEISSLFVEYNLLMEAAENIHTQRLLQTMTTVHTLDFQNCIGEKKFTSRNMKQTIMEGAKKSFTRSLKILFLFISQLMLPQFLIAIFRYHFINTIFNINIFFWIFNIKIIFFNS